MAIRVLIVDDSPLMRSALTMLLERNEIIEIVGVAHDSYDAREKIKALNPDVLTLDIEMPGMNGLAFLERLMKLRPMPVIMVSSLTRRSAEATLLSLELGAIDFVAKPEFIKGHGFEAMGEELCEKIVAASKIDISKYLDKKTSQNSNVPKSLQHSLSRQSSDLIALGASTGGVEVLHSIVTELKAPMPPIIIVQHMPAGFTKRFAERLNAYCELDIKEAKDGEVLQENMVRIAPGDYHMGVRSDGSHLISTINAGEAVSGHCPSVDYLFNSLAEHCAHFTLMAGLLTGMGRDGAQGLLKIKRLGGSCFAQNEASCLVYGMPKAALECGAVDHMLSPYEIIQMLQKGSVFDVQYHKIS